MSCCRDAAGSGLQAADSAEMRGQANGAAAVATNAAGRAAGGNGCSFAPAGTACGTGQIPGIAGFSAEEIIGFVGHQEFGRIGVAEEDGAGGFEAGDQRGVLLGNVVFAKKRTDGCGPTSDVDATLDGKGNSVERAEKQTAQDGGLRDGSLDACFLFAEVDEGIELGLAGGDAVEMGVHDFDRRKSL